MSKHQFSNKKKDASGVNLVRKYTNFVSNFGIKKETSYCRIRDFFFLLQSSLQGFSF